MRQRRGGVDVRAQHAVRQLEGPARRLRAGQRRDARGPDEAVQAVGQVVQTCERLLHRGDPGAGDLEGDRASLAEPAVSRGDGRRWDRHRVGRARLERRDRAEDLVVTEVAPRPGGVRRQRGPRRARGRPGVEADRHPARAVAHAPQRQMRERGPRSGPRRLERHDRRSDTRATQRDHRAGSASRSPSGDGSHRDVGIMSPQGARGARHEHSRGADEHGCADSANRCRTARSMPPRTHQSLAFQLGPRRGPANCTTRSRGV